MENKDQLQRDKLSTLGEMAAVFAHEIKNPLNSIIINIEVLRSTLQKMNEAEASTTKAKRSLSVIESEIKRLEKVLSGFLDLATPQESTKIRVNLNDIIHSVNDLMQLELRQKSIQIETELSEHLPRLLGSGDQIKQALLNLVINSIQAMPEGGKVTLRTGFDQKTIFVQVRDSGEGISEEIRAKIFSPYFTTKEKGSGLGLAIVRRIVREHGGYIDVANQETGGAEFTLVFPQNLREGENKPHE